MKKGGHWSDPQKKGLPISWYISIGTHFAHLAYRLWRHRLLAQVLLQKKVPAFTRIFCYHFIFPPGLARCARGPVMPTTANRKQRFAIANHFFHFLLKARAYRAYFQKMKNPRYWRGFSA